MTDFKERRKYVRIYRHFVLSCRLKGRHDTHEMSQVNNISRGGINFSSTVAFPPGSVLIIDVQTPFLKEKAQLEGEVLEVLEKIPKIIYVLRVQFQNISPQAAEALNKIEQYAAQQE